MFTFGFALGATGDNGELPGNPKTGVDGAPGEILADRRAVGDEERPAARVLHLDAPATVVDLRVPSVEVHVHFAEARRACDRPSAAAAAANEQVDADVPGDKARLMSAQDQGQGGDCLVLLRVDEERVEVSEDLAEALSAASGDRAVDLVPRVYEGGLRVWECSLDLVAFLHAHWERLGLDTHRESPRCLELGCGHGLPGVFVLQQPGCWEVCFADFNEDVLRRVTWPNVLMNSRHGSSLNARYVAGDWLSLCDALGPDSTFPLILTAETCYTEAHCAELAHLINTHLPHVGSDGLALVACKRFYFGTGGGAATFKKECAALGLLCTVGLVVDDGRSNIREVLEVRRGASG